MRPRNLYVAVVAAATLSAVVAHPQTLEQAQTLVGEGKWKEAATAYRAIIDGGVDDGAVWYGLARALHEAGDGDAAIEAYEKVLELGENPGRARYHFARLMASHGDSARALALLEQAREAGMSAYQVLMQTSEFESLHSDARFQAIAQSMKPCTAPEYGHFDFWVGEWKVRTPQGQAAGENRISRVQGGCVLLEEWTSASGGTGTSFNTYDTQNGTWRQFWVDAQGTVLNITGGLVDGAMVMSSKLDGSSVQRITWTPRDDGSVRQHWESSADGGKSWTTAFDGIYSRKKT